MIRFLYSTRVPSFLVSTRVSLPLLGMLSALAATAHAEDEGVFFGSTAPRLEQPLQLEHSVRWTLPNEATQYRPQQPTPSMLAAIVAQREGRYLDALAQVDQQGGQHDHGSLDLLRASLYLQGGQGSLAESLLKPLLADPATRADAYALSAMARLQQGDLSAALADAEHAQTLGHGSLPSLALSYALQGKGRLAEARAVMHGLNAAQPGGAVNLAREAELSLTQDDVAAATRLIEQARASDPAHPYVVAVSGLVWLIVGQTTAARSAFETALTRDPEDAKALLGLGLSAAKLGDTAGALRALQAAAEADPDSALVLTYLGLVQQKLGQGSQARRSWRQAQRADPNDPTPWLYLAQAQMQANQPVAARASLSEAQARSASRAVYRGDLLLQQDAALLQANLAETQRALGHNELAFQTLADIRNDRADILKDQAETLQGVRFAESARRSLVLQSLFHDAPGALPVALDVYGDGAGESGASTPQHGVVSSLTAQAPSYNDYGALFDANRHVQIDGVAGNHDTRGEQVRVGVGSDTVGISLAQTLFSSDGYKPFNALDNRSWQGVLQWRPAPATQAFLLYENYHSDRGETFFPADINLGFNTDIFDRSQIARLGLRHNFENGDEIQFLLSRQRASERVNYTYLFDSSTGTQASLSTAVGGDAQYRTHILGQAVQWGVAAYRAQLTFPGIFVNNRLSQQLYIASQTRFDPRWQFDWGLGWARVGGYTYGVTTHAWQPRLGLVLTPDAVSHVRLAAWQNLGLGSVGNAGLAPASLAGIVESRPGDLGTRVRAAALAFDRQMSPDWLFDARVQTRTVATPINAENFAIQHADNARVAAHWQPLALPWALGVLGEFEKTRNDDVLPASDSLSTQRLRAVQFDARWFVNTRLSAHLQWSRNWVTGAQQVPIAGIDAPYAKVFNITDAAIELRLLGNQGRASLGIRNLENTHFQYTDPDPLSPRFSIGRLVYGTLSFLW
jgi:tetratricopeptide (TPR) repeat protein